jgi:hypothetical protein
LLRYTVTDKIQENDTIVINDLRWMYSLNGYINDKLQTMDGLRLTIKTKCAKCNNFLRQLEMYMQWRTVISVVMIFARPDMFPEHMRKIMKVLRKEGCVN